MDEEAEVYSHDLPKTEELALDLRAHGVNHS